MSTKIQEKKAAGDMQNQPTSSNKPSQEATRNAPIVIQDVEDPKKIRDPAGKEPDPASIEGNHAGNQNSRIESESQIADLLESGEIHPDPGILTAAEPSGPSKEANVESLLLESEPGEETDKGS